MFQARCEYGYRDQSAATLVAIGAVDHEFPPATLTTLKGSNGTGKSTLLTTLAGYIEPLDGEVTINGIPVSSKQAAGLVHLVEEPVFIPDLTVGEHVDLVLKHAGENAQEILDLWKIDELREFAPRMLSSGQLQRVYLALSFLNPGEVMLFDEPERHLDKDWTQFLTTELRNLAEQGHVVVVASHDDVIHKHAHEVLTLD